MPIISEASEGGDIHGTDAALPNGRPAVEIIMDGSMRRESNPVVGSEPTSTRLSAAMARRAPAPKVEAPVVEAQPVETQTPVVADASADGSVPTPEEVAAAAVAAQPVEEVKPEAAKDAAVPVVAPADASGELVAARQEAAVLRAQLQGRDTSSLAEERAAYMADPLAAIRVYQARLFGLALDDKRLDGERDHLQSELTYAGIGVDTLPDDRKWQRHQEHEGRVKRLQQLAPNTSPGTDAAAQALASVATELKAAEKDYPYLAYAAELDGIDPAQAALELWSAEYRAGRTKATTDAEARLEALRLTNQHYRTRAERLHKLRPADTAPTPAPVPAQASTQAVVPGAQRQQSSTAPVTTGSASPTTLSAKQAAAAPASSVEPDSSNGPIVINPFDRETEMDRRRAIARRHRR